MNYRGFYIDKDEVGFIAVDPKIDAVLEDFWIERYSGYGIETVEEAKKFIDQYIENEKIRNKNRYDETAHYGAY